jgi:hypothetical protein
MDSHASLPNFEEAFDAEATAMICLAFDKTCHDIQGKPSDYLKEIIAKRVIAMARRGETNPDRLAEATMTSLGFISSPTV